MTRMTELLVQRLIQIETAAARNAQSPDYAGLDLIMETGVGLTAKLSPKSSKSGLGPSSKSEFKYKNRPDCIRKSLVDGKEMGCLIFE